MSLSYNFSKEYDNDLKCYIYYKPDSKIILHNDKKSRINSIFNSQYKNELMHILTYKLPLNLKENVKKYLEANYRKDDTTIFKEISSIIKNKKQDVNRSQYRINNIEKYINLEGFIPKFYLDVGCHKGDITVGIKNYFKLDKFQTRGIDIHEYKFDTDDFIFNQYDGKYIPYNDDSFDLITCFMVLHHIPPKNLEILLNEIYRVMKPGGILIIREHNIDIKNKYIIDIADILHEYYDSVLSSQDWEEIDGYYNTEQYWSSKLLEAKFIKYSSPTLRKSITNPLCNYMAAFKKGINITKMPFLRILPDDYPRIKYYRRNNEYRDFIHWGQRKLLLTEIEFLTMYLNYKRKNNITKKTVIIYAGAAPGTHIIYLNKLFKTLRFVLYDPRDFDNKLHKIKLIECYNKEFTDSDALEIKNAYADRNILFISDIRTADTETMTQEEIENCVKNDQNMQMRWYYILKPFMAMFKFRLPWNDENTTYLKGDIYFQPYAPLSSTETRLIVKENADTIEYNNRNYEENLFYFNKMRDQTYLFLNDLDNLSINKLLGAGLKNYDGAAEAHILNEYIKYTNNSITDINKIINMSNEINRVLSINRSLLSDQPLNNKKKKQFINAIKLGLVPDVNLTINNYNLYLLPIIGRSIILD